MSQKHFRVIAGGYGIGLNGIFLMKNFNLKMLDMNIMHCGFADLPTVGRIDFLPHAFISKEKLVRTLFHELVHVGQFSKYGVKYVEEHQDKFEDDMVKCFSDNC